MNGPAEPTWLNRNRLGSERWVVGLSLTSGLVQMVGQKASVDSHFMIEGFCTPSEEAFETTPETWFGLPQDGTQPATMRVTSGGLGASSGSGCEEASSCTP